MGKTGFWCPRCGLLTLDPGNAERGYCQHCGRITKGETAPNMECACGGSFRPDLDGMLIHKRFWGHAPIPGGDNT